MRGLIGTVLVALIAGHATEARSATVAAATCNAGDVQTAMSRALAGDVVAVPAGTCRWTTGLAWNAPPNVTLAGAGTTAVGGGDRTVIIDDLASNRPLLDVSVASTGTFRMTGITLRGGAGVLKDGGVVKLNGPGTVRLDHMRFNMQSYASGVQMRLMVVGGGIRGVLDSSILDLYGLGWIHVVNGRSNGDLEWAEPTGFGTSDFFFIESNQVNGMASGAVYNSTLTDCHTGGKFVVRFNTMVSTVISQTHPTGHSRGDDRGCRAHENYGNVVTSPLASEPNFAMDYNNSGGALVWGNSVNNVYKNVLYFNICRTGSGDCGYSQNAAPGGWGYCNGSSPWDQNTDGTGYACIDQPGRGQGDRLTGSYETSNRRNSASGTVSNPRQVREPVYEWNTTGSIVSGWGGNWLAVYTPTRIQQNRDFYLHHGNTGCNAGAASCTTGVGVGALAQRPASCTPGVAYWATDQGSWNTTTSNAYGVQQNGADGVLFKCTAANTWTLHYTPYTFPHPLTQSQPAAPLTSPTNLRLSGP